LEIHPEVVGAGRFEIKIGDLESLQRCGLLLFKIYGILQPKIPGFFSVGFILEDFSPEACFWVEDFFRVTLLVVSFLAAVFLPVIFRVAAFPAAGFFAEGFAWVFLFVLEGDFFRIRGVCLDLFTGLAGVDISSEDASSMSMSTPKIDDNSLVSSTRPFRVLPATGG